MEGGRARPSTLQERTLRPQREDRDGERPDIPPKRAIFGSARSENSIFTVFFRLGMLFSTPGYDHPIWSPHSPNFHQPRCTSVWVMLTWHRGGPCTLPHRARSEGVGSTLQISTLPPGPGSDPPLQDDPPMPPPIVFCRNELPISHAGSPGSPLSLG